MARKYDAISKLNASKNEWKIRVRVLRLWKVPQYQNKNQIKKIGMVFIDDKVIFYYIFVSITTVLIYSRINKTLSYCLILFYFSPNHRIPLFKHQSEQHQH